MKKKKTSNQQKQKQQQQKPSFQIYSIASEYCKQELFSYPLLIFIKKTKKKLQPLLSNILSIPSPS